MTSRRAVSQLLVLSFVVALLPLGLAASSGGAHVARVDGASRGHLGPTPVLGAKAFAGRNGVGWGTYRPREIFNGGDPSGLVTSISWTMWGKAVAVGSGRTSIFKPGGGYYPVLVTAQLRASDLGRCAPGGALTYRHLEVRVPNRPGGAFGSWFAWSGAKTLCVAAFSMMSTRGHALRGEMAISAVGSFAAVVERG